MGAQLTLDNKRASDEKYQLSADSEGLGLWGDKKTFVVGHLPEVKWSEACEVSEFVPTSTSWFRLRSIGSIVSQTTSFLSSHMPRSVAQSCALPLRPSSDKSHREILPEHELNLALEKVERDLKQQWKISDDVLDIFKKPNKRAMGIISGQSSAGTWDSTEWSKRGKIKVVIIRNQP